jgi:hypothetical protein
LIGPKRRASGGAGSEGWVMGGCGSGWDGLLAAPRR